MQIVAVKVVQSLTATIRTYIIICARRQFACVLRNVLAVSKQVNLPVFTGKLHVTQVNCAGELFTCELHVRLPAFAGNFARARFSV